MRFPSNTRNCYIALKIIGYINKTHTRTESGAVKFFISVLSDYRLQNHFLRSISRKGLAIEVPALGEFLVLFHAPLVSEKRPMSFI